VIDYVSCQDWPDHLLKRNHDYEERLPQEPGFLSRLLSLRRNVEMIVMRMLTVVFLLILTCN